VNKVKGKRVNRVRKIFGKKTKRKASTRTGGREREAGRRDQKKTRQIQSKKQFREEIKSDKKNWETKGMEAKERSGIRRKTNLKGDEGSRRFIRIARKSSLLARGQRRKVE